VAARLVAGKLGEQIGKQNRRAIAFGRHALQRPGIWASRSIYLHVGG
jgi:hypothetical protein